MICGVDVLIIVEVIFLPVIGIDAAIAVEVFERIVREIDVSIPVQIAGGVRLLGRRRHNLLFDAVALLAGCLLLTDLHALLGEGISHTLQTGADDFADLLAHLSTFFAGDGTANSPADATPNATRVINGLVGDSASDLARHLANPFADAFGLVTVQQIAHGLANRSADSLARAFTERLGHGALLARPFLLFLGAALLRSLRAASCIRTRGRSPGSADGPREFGGSLLDATDWIGGHCGNTGHSLTCRLLDSASGIITDGGSTLWLELAWGG